MDISLSDHEKQNVESPCINVCVLGEDNICAGCFRTLSEIADWGYASNEHRRQVVTNSRHRKEKANGD